MNNQVTSLLHKQFPVIAGNKALASDLLSVGQFKTFPKDMTLMLEGEPCTGLMLVLDGKKRVYKLSETGREITLYEVANGDICSLTTSSVLSGSPSLVNVQTLTEINAFMLPGPALVDLITRYEDFRRFVFGIVARETSLVMQLIVEVTFKRMDERLMEYLKSNARQGKVEATHQKIASDLGTAREVVSRLLKDLERQGLVGLSRGTVDCAGLLAAS